MEAAKFTRFAVNARIHSCVTRLFAKNFLRSILIDPSNMFKPVCYRYSAVLPWKSFSPLDNYSSFPSLEYLRNATKRYYSTKPYSERFTLKNEVFRNYLSSIVAEYHKINDELISGESSDNEMLSARLVELSPITCKTEELEQKTKEHEEIQKLLGGLPEEEVEMRSLAEQERLECTQVIEGLEKEVASLLIPDELADENDIILELTAGVGGQEAMLFSHEMFNMYNNYALYKGWTFDIISYDKSDMGGLRRASASISGTDVYMLLKFEGGVHRVQRIPQTEKAGRVHTSTMTVAVLPLPTEIDIVIHPKDLQIDTCRASGKGGQHVNTTDSAVRIVHLPTGTVAECQQERSQIKNRETAMNVLKSRIYQKQLEEQVSQRRQNRKLQVGSAGRSEKIRTYNFSQDRITDHRLSENFHNIEGLMLGSEQLDLLIKHLCRESRAEVLTEILSNYQLSKS